MGDMVRDLFGRPLRTLRVSITDRCNLRCQYCMPEEEYVWLPKPSLLTFEELTRLVDLFTRLGVHKIRLTGGEPLLRQDVPDLVGMIAAVPGVSDLALTTNGTKLSQFAPALQRAGLDRVTVSLDTMREDRFHAFTRRAKLGEVLRALQDLKRLGFSGTKINSVVTRGFNEDEVLDLLAFAASVNAEIRFIEYMDVGGATRWSMEKVVSRAQILDMVRSGRGPVESIIRSDDSSAPADRFRLSDGTTFGIIASTTEPFCRTCDRARLTADGMLYMCLYSDRGVDLRDVVRSGASDQQILEVIADHWHNRSDRGAERRKESAERGVLYQISSLRSDPHREMHTRGG